jgi:hypothetical protein
MKASPPIRVWNECAKKKKKKEKEKKTDKTKQKQCSVQMATDGKRLPQARPSLPALSSERP